MPSTQSGYLEYMEIGVGEIGQGDTKNHIHHTRPITTDLRKINWIQHAKLMTFVTISAERTTLAVKRRGADVFEIVTQGWFLQRMRLEVFGGEQLLLP